MAVGAEGRTRCGWAVALAFLLVSASQAAPASDEMDRVMAALAQRKHGHVTFTEQKFIALLERPVASSGELLYDAPDRLEKRTLEPKAESLVLQGGVVTAKRGRRTYVLDLQQYPQILPFIESIRATLAGDRAALERVFQIGFNGSYSDWTLELAPHDAQLAGTVRQIRIEGAQDRIRSVQIRQADGDRSVLTIGTELNP